MGLEDAIDYGPAWQRYRKLRRVATIGSAVGGLALIFASQAAFYPALVARAGLGASLLLVILMGALVFPLEAFHCPRCGKLFRGLGGLRSIALIRQSRCGYCGIGVGENPSKLG